MFFVCSIVGKVSGWKSKFRVVVTASFHIEPSFSLFCKNLNKLVTLYKVVRHLYGINML